MSETLTLHGWFKGIRPLKDHTTLHLALPNNQLSTEVMGRLAQLSISEQEGFFMLKTADFDPKEVEIMNAAEVDPEDGRKTPAQRQRGMLYVLWQKHPEGYQDFELFYRFKMNQLASFIKRAIDKET